MNLRKHGFTLIELLVVISIIVVLLALLVPALDRAIYSAEMTVCATNLKGVATGTTSYAAANKRYYPVAGSPKGVARNLKQGPDLRPLIRDYVSVNSAFNDPFTDKVDYELIEPDGWAWLNHTWYAAWGFNGYRQMSKMGDRMGWSGADNQSPLVRNFNFNIIIGDRMRHWDSETSWSASHADDDGKLIHVALQNSKGRAEGTASNNAANATIRAGDNLDTGGLGEVTLAEWVNTTGEIGLLDLNWAFADGSVKRYDDLDGFDPRLVAITHDRDPNARSDLLNLVPDPNQ